MKIVKWKDLNGFLYQKDKGTFRKNGHTYYLNVCKTCGFEFFGYKGTQYCDHECFYQSGNTGMKGKKFPKEGVQRLKDLWSDKSSIYNSKEYRNKLKVVNKGSKNGNWKGGIKNKTLYDTYAHQIRFIENVRKDGKWLEVKCVKCNRWFKPSRSEISNRLQFLNSNRSDGEFAFYCSDVCKSNCHSYRLSEKHLLSRINKTEYDLYRSLVYKYTRMSYKLYKNVINPNKFKRGRNKYHLDHKYSIKRGFDMGILPSIIGSPSNLIMLTEYENINKGDKCSITIEELYRKNGRYNEHYRF